MEPPELTADGLLLRGWRPDDAPAVHRACQDPDIQRWTGVPSPYRPEHAAGFVTEIAPNSWADGSGSPFADPHPQGTSDGWVGSQLPADLDRPVDEARWGSGSLVVAPWARGRGYAPAALAALCEWGGKALGLARIEWRARVGNEASRRAAEKAGFAYEGTTRAALNFRGQRLDAWVGALVPGGTR